MGVIPSPSCLTSRHLKFNLKSHSVEHMPPPRPNSPLKFNQAAPNFTHYQFPTCAWFPPHQDTWYIHWDNTRCKSKILQNWIGSLTHPASFHQSFVVTLQLLLCYLSHEQTNRLILLSRATVVQWKPRLKARITCLFWSFHAYHMIFITTLWGPLSPK